MPVEPDQSTPAEPLPQEPAAADANAAETISLLEEVLRIGKREVETGRVRVSLLTDTEQHAVTEILRSRRVDVQRIAVERRLEAGEVIPQSRMEGDELVVSIVEERLVIEKRLVVTEELRIRVVHAEKVVKHVVPLRRQRAVVEHLPPTNDDVGS